MILKTGRAEGPAQVRIDYDACSVCGLCTKVCSGPLEMREGKVQVNQDRFWGCIGCGHCMAICPKECVHVEGRDLFPEDAIPMPGNEPASSFDALNRLLASRRSIRAFQDRPVEHEITEKILLAASWAPMGIPPTEVNVLVLESREKVREFKNDLLPATQKMRSSIVMKLLLRVMAKEQRDMFRTFIFPIIDGYVESDKQGVDIFFYDAPLAMVFNCSASGDPADALIAATYSMLAAESLGLGSCLLGLPAHILKYNKDIRKKYGLPDKITPGVALVFGYPVYNYRRAIRRRFAQVVNY